MVSLSRSGLDTGEISPVRPSGPAHPSCQRRTSIGPQIQQLLDHSALRLAFTSRIEVARRDDIADRIRLANPPGSSAQDRPKRRRLTMTSDNRG